jgi:hypothetical protein
MYGIVKISGNYSTRRVTHATTTLLFGDKYAPGDRNCHVRLSGVQNFGWNLDRLAGKPDWDRADMRKELARSILKRGKREPAKQTALTRSSFRAEVECVTIMCARGQKISTVTKLTLKTVQNALKRRK